MTRRILAVAGASALQLIALVLAHDLTFLVRFGSRYGEALAHAGHGATWTAAVASSVILAVVLAALGVGRLLYLWTRLRGRGSAHSPAADGLRTFLRSWLRAAVRVGLIGVLLLTIQENAERVAIGQVAPGPGILLSPEYPFGLWIALAVSAAVALVATLYQRRERLLVARLRAARHVAIGARTSAVRRHLRVAAAASSILGRFSGLRAPPVPVPA